MYGEDGWGLFAFRTLSVLNMMLAELGNNSDFPQLPDCMQDEHLRNSKPIDVHLMLHHGKLV